MKEVINMAGINIKNLTNTTTISDNDYVIVEQSTGTKKVTVADITKSSTSVYFGDNNDIIQLQKPEMIEKVNNLETNFTKVSSQLDQKADKETTQGIQAQVTSLVLGAVGDGNNAEVFQARVSSQGGVYKTLNSRIYPIEKDLDEVKYGKKINVSFELGNIYQGGITEGNTRIRTTGYINSEIYKKLKIVNKDSENLSFWLIKYNPTGTYNTNVTFIDEIELDCENNFYKLVGSYKDNKQITDISDLISKLYIGEMEQELIKLNAINNLMDKKYLLNWVIGANDVGKNSNINVYNNANRIVARGMYYTDTELVVNMDFSKYITGIIFYEQNGNYKSDTGWITSKYIIPANSYFGGIVVSRISNEVPVTDVYGELFNSISITESISFKSIENNYRGEKIYNKFEIGNIYQGNNADSTTRIRTNDYINPSSKERYIVVNERPDLIETWAVVYFDNGSYMTNISIKDYKEFYGIKIKLCARYLDNRVVNNLDEITKYITIHLKDKNNLDLLKNQNKIRENKKMFIESIAHQGLNFLAPNSTISAFRKAVENDFDTIELDLKFTSDNVPVICHDMSIDNVSNGTGLISSMTLEQIKTYDFGSWYSSKFAGEKIPTLEETLIFCKNHNIDICLDHFAMANTDEKIKLVFNLINKYGMKNHTSYSTDYNGLDFVKKILTYDKKAHLIISLGDSIIDEMLIKINELKTDFNKISISLNDSLFNNDNVMKIRNYDFGLYLWGNLDNPVRYNSIMAYSDGIVSNKFSHKDILYMMN